MLVYCFWLFEFKFVFRFNCLVPFSIQQKLFLFSIPSFSFFWPILASNQLQQRCSPTTAQRRPASASVRMLPPTCGGHLSSPFLRRARAGLELEFQPPSRPILWPARQGAISRPKLRRSAPPSARHLTPNPSYHRASLHASQPQPHHHHCSAPPSPFRC